MPTKRDGQRWILDALLNVGGYDVLHPGIYPVFVQFGYDVADLDRVFDGVQASLMVRDRFGAVGGDLERKADYWAARGFTSTATNLYLRAALIYGRAFYSYYSDDPRRVRYQNCTVRCFNKVIETSPHPVERVELPFQDKTLYGLFESPSGGLNRPCVIMLPGMDMFKEDWHNVIANRIIPRGWNAFALDGPGQGESLTNGLKVSVNNYEEAVATVIDWLSARPEVNADQIVAMGVSMGSYWGTRTAAKEPRLKAVATSMSCYGSKQIIFNIAQTNFKTNFMFMAGYTDEDEFDQLAAEMINDDLYPQITCPTLMVTGEYDELTTLDDTLAAYDTITAPKELWVYGHEFHPIGPVAAEWLNASLEWLAEALAGNIKPGHDRKLYITRSGEYQEGSGEPASWRPRE